LLTDVIEEHIQKVVHGVMVDLVKEELQRVMGLVDAPLPDLDYFKAMEQTAQEQEMAEAEAEPMDLGFMPGEKAHRKQADEVSRKQGQQDCEEVLRNYVRRFEQTVEFTTFNGESLNGWAVRMERNKVALHVK